MIKLYYATFKWLVFGIPPHPAPPSPPKTLGEVLDEQYARREW